VDAAALSMPGDPVSDRPAVVAHLSDKPGVLELNAEDDVTRSAAVPGDWVMDRRMFLGTLAGGLLAAEGQQADKMARIGWLAVNLAASPTCARPFSKDCVSSVTSRAATS
jgi:hypothetical protein